MKKLIAIVMALTCLVTCFSLSACSDSADRYAYDGEWIVLFARYWDDVNDTWVNYYYDDDTPGTVTFDSEKNEMRIVTASADFNATVPYYGTNGGNWLKHSKSYFESCTSEKNYLFRSEDHGNKHFLSLVSPHSDPLVGGITYRLARVDSLMTFGEDFTIDCDYVYGVDDYSKSLHLSGSARADDGHVYLDLENEQVLYGFKKVYFESVVGHACIFDKQYNSDDGRRFMAMCMDVDGIVFVVYPNESICYKPVN